MVSYALDIENHRIKFALNELGISESELMNKSLEDFASPKTATEIQSLRYQFYQNQLKSAVTEIKTFLKQGKRPRKAGISTSPKIKLLTSLKCSDENELNSKQKNFLITAVSPFMFSPRGGSLNLLKPEPRVSTFSSVEKPVSRFKEFEEKQKEKIKEIRKQQFELQKNYSEQLVESMRVHEERGKRLDLEKQREKQEKDAVIKYRNELVKEKLAQNDKDCDCYIKEKLDQIDKRLQRSAEIHQKCLNKKIKNAKKFRNFESLTENLKKINYKNEVEQVNKLNEKHALAYQNRIRLEEIGREEILTKREVFEKNREKANEKIRKTEKEFFQKTARIENRIFESEKIVKKHRDEKMKELKIKQEIHRLKKKAKEVNLTRAKKRLENKTAERLEKIILDDLKIEEIKNNREKNIERNRDLAIKMMIKKEKINDLILMASRSPNGRLVQENLIKWNIIARAKTPERMNG